MKVNVKVDLSGVARKLSKENIRQGKLSMMDNMLADMNQFVPFREGTLSQTGIITADEEGLKWDTKYAKAQFYGMVGRPAKPVRQYTTSKHPRAGKRWDLKAQGLYMDSWKKAFIDGSKLK